MLTSITVGMLESEISMCQILVQSVLSWLNFFFLFLLNNIEIALSGNCFSECIFKLVAFNLLLADTKMYCFLFVVFL